MITFKSECKSYLLKNCLTPINWSLLIMNKQASYLISKIFTKSDLLSNKFLKIDFLESPRKKANYEATYLIFSVRYRESREDLIDNIINDLKSETYTAFNIYVFNDQKLYNKLKNLINEKIKIFYLQFNFLVLEDNFLICNNLAIESKYFENNQINNKIKKFDCNLSERTIENFIESLSEILDCSFNFHTIKNINTKNDNFTTLNYENLINIFKSLSKRNNNDFIYLTRDFDYLTPLVYFLELNSLLSEFNISFLKKKFDKNYDSLKNVHLAELSTHLAKISRKLQETSSKLRDSSKIDTNELAVLLLEAPENVKKKENLNFLIKIVEFLIENFKKKQNQILELQNRLLTNKKEDESSYKLKLKDINTILSSNFTLGEKVRIVMMCIMTNELRGKEKEELKNYISDKFLYKTDQKRILDSKSNSTLNLSNATFYEKEFEKNPNLKNLEKILEQKFLIEKSEDNFDLQTVNIKLTELLINFNLQPPLIDKSISHKYKYTSSRFVPLIFYFLKNFLSPENSKTSESFKKFNLETVFKKKNIKSLRNTKFSVGEKFSGRTVVIFFEGGVSRKEVDIIEELGDTYGVRVIVSSSEVINGDLYCRKWLDGDYT